MRSLKTYLVAALAFASLSATAQTKKVVDRVDQRTVQELDHQDVTTKFKSLVCCPYSGQWMAE